MKILLLIILTIITSCKVLQDKYLYDENSPSYGALEEAAAKECLENNAIFDNLKSTTFAGYDILKDNNYIKIADKVFIWINAVESESVTFTVISNGDNNSSSFKPFLFKRKYSVSLEMNNAIVDMLANGVCGGGDYDGTPSSSTSLLNFSVNNYYVQDGSDLGSTDTPSEYEEREDSFSMSTSHPAFLFLWAGTYQTYDKDDDETVRQTTSDLALELSILDSDLAGCESAFEDDGDEDDCTEVLGDTTTLTVDTDAYKKTRSSSNDNILKTFYFTSFAPTLF